MTECYRMCRACVLIIVIIGIGLMAQNAKAESPIKGIKIEPSIPENILVLGTEEEIIINLDVETQTLQFKWHIEGPKEAGELLGDRTGDRIIYIPPKAIKSASIQVKIIVEVTDNEGKTWPVRPIIFTILQPTPMPTPVVIPTPTPTVAPTRTPTPTPTIAPTRTPTPTPTQMSTPTPTVTPIQNQPRIRSVTITDAKGLYLWAGNDGKYHVKPGETLMIAVMVDNPSNLKYTIEYDPKDHLQSEKYIAPNTPGNSEKITIKLFTNALADTKAIELKVIETLHN